jgi:thioredoxin-disulfide reductase
MRAMPAVAFMTLMAASLFVALAEDVPVEKLRIKQLKEILAARGVKCTGCVEKPDFVKMVKETADVKELPVAPPPSYYETGQVKEVTSHQAYLGGLAKHRDETNLPVVVDFFSHSCGPCIQIAPLYADLAQEYAGRAVFWKVDVNRNYETSSQASVRSMPTFQFFLNNQKFHEFSGGDPQGLRQTVQQMVQQVENEGGPFVNMEVTTEAIKEFYEKHKDKVGAKANPEAIAEKYKSKVALLVRHFKAKYGSAPRPTKIKYRPRTKADDQKPSSSAAPEQKCATVDPEQVIADLPAETLEGELEKRRQIEAMSGDMFEKSDITGSEEKVVVIGGGPAGLAAAIYAARAGLSPMVIAPSFGGQLLGKGVDVENFPGVVGAQATGRGIVQLMRKQAFGFESRLVDDSVVNADLTKHPFELTLNNTQGPLKTHTIIIATGADSRWLGAPGEFKYRGGGVSSCATCDGFLFRDKHVVVIGGGDTAMEDALVLARTSSKVTVVHRRDSFRASHVLADRVLNHPLIEVKWNCTVSEFVGEPDGDDKHKLTHVVVKHKDATEEKIEVGAAFVAIGHDPNTKIFKNVLKMDDAGYLEVVGRSSKTSVDGVFAAGDVADKVYRQAVTSAGTGAMAALDAERWLSEHGLGV